MIITNTNIVTMIITSFCLWVNSTAKSHYLLCKKKKEQEVVSFGKYSSIESQSRCIDFKSNKTTWTKRATTKLTWQHSSHIHTTSPESKRAFHVDGKLLCRKKKKKLNCPTRKVTCVYSNQNSIFCWFPNLESMKMKVTKVNWLIQCQLF